MRNAGGFVQASLFVLWIATGLGAADVAGQTRAYVASCVDTLAVLDVTTNELITTIPVGSSPSAVAITPDGSRAYVANTLSGTLSVIDTATNQGIDIILILGLAGPLQVAITPDGSRAYVTNQGFPSISPPEDRAGMPRGHGLYRPGASAARR